jgi:hypothetical protein
VSAHQVLDVYREVERRPPPASTCYARVPMGQRTEHTTYRCPCGLGSVVLTTTLFGGGGSRRIHTELVRCTACKGKYRYLLSRRDDGPLAAEAEPMAPADGARVVLLPSPD